VKDITLLGFGYLGYQVYRILKNRNYNIKVISPVTWYQTLLHDDDDFVEITNQTINNKDEYSRILSSEIMDKSVVIYAMGSINATSPFSILESEFKDYYCDFFELLKICNSKNIANFIFFSSGGTIYGNNNKELINENDKADPINAYGLQKLCFEQMLKINRAEGGCPYLIARISNPYGGIIEPGREQGIIPVVLRRIFNNAPLQTWVPDSTTRDYIHAEDMAKSIANIIEKGIIDDVFNVASGVGETNGDIYKLCEKITNTKLQIERTVNKTSIIPRNVLDITKLKNAGCSFSEISFEDGIRELADRIKNQ